ncbi:MAG TPA: RNA-binding protein [Firmicutes bacterium]|nr:RNA-binding protein [Bacillota bacterium]HAW70362.1 RNA-binding protein [Bacillota bacterium]HAZ21084.1 RNA-binding protein [Bacillota bacterium]HBG45131.1 RNA-binding protein [Bacillota bacterium]HBL49370.1 RNA-binding protein [Bacillota bacterium]
MSARPVQIGQKVISKAGRDRGREYLVYRLLDYKTVLVTDGNYRPVGNPKKKKVQHIDLCQEIAAEIAAKIEKGIHVGNEEVRQALEGLRKERERGEQMLG